MTILFIIRFIYSRYIKRGESPSLFGMLRFKK